MSTLAPGVPGRQPRRARYLIPRGTPRRRDLLAILGLLAVLAGLLLAQVTVMLALVLDVTGRIGRWRPRWLAVPATGGLIWMLALGPVPGVDGFTAMPRAVLAMLARLTPPALFAHPATIPGTLAHLLPGQFPVALLAAPALAAGAWWLRWLHTDEWDLPVPRPGLASICRGKVAAAFIRSGNVLTSDGVCLGVDRASGRPAALSWQEAERGVLVTGANPPDVQASVFQLLHAAIRRRRPVIAVDLAGSPGLASAVAVACAAAGAPLQVFGADGDDCYEPWRDGDPAGTAALVMGLVDWEQAPEQALLSCRSWLTDVLTVMAATAGSPGNAVLDEVAALLHPGALRARLERVPSYHPGRQALTERARMVASRMDADQPTTALVAGQLRALRATPLGRWLCAGPTPPGAGVTAGTGRDIRLGEVVRRRGVALFSLDRTRNGRVADLVADLVALDLAGVCAALHRDRLAGDGLAWFGGYDRAVPSAYAGLLGEIPGFAAVASTTSPEVAARLAEQARVLVLHRLDDPALATRLSWLAGARLRPARPGMPVPEDLSAAQGPGQARQVTGGGGTPAPAGMTWYPVVTGQALCGLGEGEFTLIARGPAGSRGRLVPRARAVTGRIPGPPGTVPVSVTARAPAQPGVAAGPWPSARAPGAEGPGLSAQPRVAAEPGPLPAHGAGGFPVTGGSPPVQGQGDLTVPPWPSRRPR